MEVVNDSVITAPSAASEQAVASLTAGKSREEPGCCDLLWSLFLDDYPTVRDVRTDEDDRSYASSVTATTDATEESFTFRNRADREKYLAWRRLRALRLQQSSMDEEALYQDERHFYDAGNRHSTLSRDTRESRRSHPRRCKDRYSTSKDDRSMNSALYATQARVIGTNLCATPMNQPSDLTSTHKLVTPPALGLELQMAADNTGMSDEKEEGALNELSYETPFELHPVTRPEMPSALSLPSRSDKETISGSLPPPAAATKNERSQTWAERVTKHQLEKQQDQGQQHMPKAVDIHGRPPVGNGVSNLLTNMRSMMQVKLPSTHKGKTNYNPIATRRHPPAADILSIGRGCSYDGVTGAPISGAAIARMAYNLGKNGPRKVETKTTQLRSPPQAMSPPVPTPQSPRKHEHDSAPALREKNADRLPSMDELPSRPSLPSSVSVPSPVSGNASLPRPQPRSECGIEDEDSGEYDFDAGSTIKTVETPLSRRSSQVVRTPSASRVAEQEAGSVHSKRSRASQGSRRSPVHMSDMRTSSGGHVGIQNHCDIHSTGASTEFGAKSLYDDEHVKVSPGEYSVADMGERLPFDGTFDGQSRLRTPVIAVSIVDTASEKIETSAKSQVDRSGRSGRSSTRSASTRSSTGRPPLPNGPVSPRGCVSTETEHRDAASMMSRVSGTASRSSRARSRGSRQQNVSVRSRSSSSSNSHKRMGEVDAAVRDDDSMASSGKGYFWPSSLLSRSTSGAGSTQKQDSMEFVGAQSFASGSRGRSLTTGSTTSETSSKSWKKIFFSKSRSTETTRSRSFGSSSRNRSEVE